MPDGDAAHEGLTGFLARFRKVLNPVFGRIHRGRDMSKCLFEGRTFVWTYIVGFLMRMGSRNAMDANRNDPNYAAAIHALAGQEDWPEGLERRAPCSEQCCNFLRRGCTKMLEEALVDLVCHMIRLKLLDCARFRGMFVIAVKPKVILVGQLWENGPIWAECNVGGTVSGDYGDVYIFNDSKAADAAASLGDGWRLPSGAELKALLDNCDSEWTTSKDSAGADINGCRFTGKGDYSSNSIFLPAAGQGTTHQQGGKFGFYWSSSEQDSLNATNLLFNKTIQSVDVNQRSIDMSVRAVRDAK